ncbi:BEL1 homeodomain protein [Salix suchowensis]|nr:BEL1 homeodomain protein [Salix suchowensis]
MAVGMNSRRRIKEEVRYEVTAGAGESTRTRELLKRLGGEAMLPRLSDTVNETNTGDEANGDNNLGRSKPAS